MSQAPDGIDLSRQRSRKVRSKTPRFAVSFALLLTTLAAFLPSGAVIGACLGNTTGEGEADLPRSPANRAKLPNIVVFLIDDLGVMDTSVPFLTDEQGRPESYPLNEFYRTPNVERLAGQGVRFGNFYAMSVCSPTRVSLMTGQTSARHHITQWIDPAQANRGKFGPPDWNWRGLAENSVTLPRLLQKAGYRTIHCGKGHFGPFDSAGSDPKNLGFDLNVGGSAAGQPGSYYGKDNFGNNPGPRARWGVPSLEKYHGQELFLTEALTREFNAAIGEAVADGQPFFGYFAHYAVHAPFQPDPRFIGNYQGEKRDLAAFASLVEGMDDSIGKVVSHLEQLGVAEQTLLVFLGDNGSDSPRGDQNAISCAAPLRGKKGTHYEGGMRAPCLITWAKPMSGTPIQEQWPIQSNSVCSQIAAVYDIAPTLLELATGTTAGLPPPIDGRNLWPELAGGKPPSDISFLMHFPHEHRSNYFTVLRRGDWKLVYHWRRGLDQRTELFQLGRDPSESENLTLREPEQLRTMLTAMQQALDEAGAQLPLADDRATPLKIEIPD
jgi:arylsulfatase A-like enzyme